MDRPPRRVTSAIFGVVAFVAAYMYLFPTGCDSVTWWLLGTSNTDRP